MPGFPEKWGGKKEAMKLGANTWIWVSPLTDERLTQLAPRVRDMGFDVIELPVEQLGDWSPEHAAEVLAEHGLGASIAVAMAPGRELCGADAETVATTQAFLRECLDVAADGGGGRDRRPDLHLHRQDLADHAG